MSMRILSSHPYGGIKSSALLYAMGSKYEDIRRFLGYWADHRAVLRLRLVDRAAGAVVFKVALKSEVAWVTKAILDNNGYFSTSIPVAGGIENWRVFIEDENKTTLLSQLDKVGALRVDQISRLKLSTDGRLAMPSPVSNLTSRQLRVLRVAVDGGYFESPRRIDSRELAKKIGIAQSTFLEHLRKAETKILRQALAQ